MTVYQFPIDLPTREPGTGFTPVERAELLYLFLGIEVDQGWVPVADHGTSIILDQPPRRKVIWVDQAGHLQHQWVGRP